ACARKRRPGSGRSRHAGQPDLSRSALWRGKIAGSGQGVSGCNRFSLKTSRVERRLILQVIRAIARGTGGDRSSRELAGVCMERKRSILVTTLVIVFALVLLVWISVPNLLRSRMASDEASYVAKLRQQRLARLVSEESPSDAKVQRVS